MVGSAQGRASTRLGSFQEWSLAAGRVWSLLEADASIGGVL